MQTFLPDPIFVNSARVLDNKRLGKQRIETLQLLQVLEQGPWCIYNTIEKKYIYGPIDPVPEFCILKRTPWYNHPAARMWRGHLNYLTIYGEAICDEWIKRGFRDSTKPKIVAFYKQRPGENLWHCPDWLGNEKFHASHRAALLFKNPEYYGKFGWTETPEKNYLWPK